jgi:hypothetical protein
VCPPLLTCACLHAIRGCTLTWARLQDDTNCCALIDACKAGHATLVAHVLRATLATMARRDVTDVPSASASPLLPSACLLALAYCARYGLTSVFTSIDLPDDAFAWTIPRRRNRRETDDGLEVSERVCVCVCVVVCCSVLSQNDACVICRVASRCPC